MAFTWDSVPLPLPAHDGISGDILEIGNSRRMGGGGLQTDHIAQKNYVKIDWRGVSTTDRNTIRSTFLSKSLGAYTLVLPSGLTFTAHAKDGYHEKEFSISATVTRWNISIVFEEQ